MSKQLMKHRKLTIDVCPGNIKCFRAFTVNRAHLEDFNFPVLPEKKASQRY